MIRPSRLAPLLLLAAMLVAASAQAQLAPKFDMIIIDRPVYFMCTGCDLRVVGADPILIINTGTTDITEQELRDAQLSVKVKNFNISFNPFVNPFRDDIGPVKPGEVVGWVNSAINPIMLKMVGADETYRKCGPLFITDVTRRYPYDGAFQADLALRIGNHEATFSIIGDVRTASELNVWYFAATRVTAYPISTPVVATTWGALKRLYR